jgi:hypothetical protein
MTNFEFNAAHVSEATGVPRTALLNWIKRGVISFARNKETEAFLSPGIGVSRFFSRAGVIRIAIVHRLSRAGVPLEVGNIAANRFLYYGAPGAAYGNQIPVVERQPGGFFADGSAFLRLGAPMGQADDEIDWSYDVIPAGEVSLDDAGDRAVIFLDLAALVRSVTAKLQTNTDAPGE